MKKRIQKKRGYQPSRTAKRLEITDLDVVRYRQEQSKANRRIARLQSEGLEPRILTFILSALDASQFPNISDIGTSHEFINTYNLLKRFNRNTTTLIKGARVEEQSRYDNFVSMLQRATGQNYSEETYKAIFPYLGGINFKELLVHYEYEEVVNMMFELHTRGVAPTNDYVKRALDDGIYYALSEYLAQYIPRDFIFDTGDMSNGGINQIRDFDFYVNYALHNGVQAAIDEYNSDKSIKDLNSYDFMD